MWQVNACTSECRSGRPGCHQENVTFVSCQRYIGVTSSLRFVTPNLVVVGVHVGVVDHVENTATFSPQCSLVFAVMNYLHTSSGKLPRHSVRGSVSRVTEKVGGTRRVTRRLSLAHWRALQSAASASYLLNATGKEEQNNGHPCGPGF